MLLRGELQVDGEKNQILKEKNENTLYMKSLSMPLINKQTKTDMHKSMQGFKIDKNLRINEFLC